MERALVYHKVRGNEASLLQADQADSSANGFECKPERLCSELLENSVHLDKV